MKITDSTRITSNQRRVLERIIADPGICAREITERTAIAYPSAVKAAKALARRGLISIQRPEKLTARNARQNYYPTPSANTPPPGELVSTGYFAKGKPNPSPRLKPKATAEKNTSPVALPRRFEFKPYTPPKNDTPARPGALDHTRVPSLRHSGERVPYAPPSVHCTGRHINHLAGLPNNPRHAL